MDATSDPVALSPGIAQNLVNLLTERRGLLRGQMQVTNLALSSFTAGIDGLGYLYAQNVTFSNSSTSTSPLAARLVVVSNGSVNSYPLISPPTFPPTFNVGGLVTSGGLITGQKARMVAFGQEMYIVQEANAYSNYRMLYSGVIVSHGILAPQASDWTAVTQTPSVGPSVKSGTVQYNITFYDSLGRETSPCLTPKTIAYGSSPSVDGKITVNFSAYTAPRDVQGANVYATTPGGTLFYFIGAVAVTGGNVEDNIADVSVGGAAQIAPNFGENDAPKPASLIAVHKNRVILNQTGSSRIQISNDGSATQFNSQGYKFDQATLLISNPSDGITLSLGTDQGDSPTAMMSFGSLFLVWKRRSIYVLYGNDLTDFEVKPVHNSKGCIAPDSAVRCDNEIFFLADDGVYALTSSLQCEKISKPIESLLAPLRLSLTGRAQMETAQGWFVQNEYNLAINDTIYVFNFDVKQWSIRQF